MAEALKKEDGFVSEWHLPSCTYSSLSLPEATHLTWPGPAQLKSLTSTGMFAPNLFDYVSLSDLKVRAQGVVIAGRS